MYKTKKLAKRGDILVSRVARLSKVESFLVAAEKKSGMPSKFKVPQPIIKFKLQGGIKQNVIRTNKKKS